ncbi:hypothetical protein [Rhizobium sp. NFR07]|uniref:hypothetical protein n=1 Tax=Rhizobium sp. NFR07 TaxID=1566262 RepID=UPI0011608B01|nr:hypothetical protein [Rhizobium sp. NFR07]
MMRFIFLLLFSRPAKEPFRCVNRSELEFTFSDALKRLESAERYFGRATYVFCMRGFIGVGRRLGGETLRA